MSLPGFLVSSLFTYHMSIVSRVHISDDTHTYFLFLFPFSVIPLLVIDLLAGRESCGKLHVVTTLPSAGTFHHVFVHL
jgi:hypothetical protein